MPKKIMSFLIIVTMIISCFYTSVGAIEINNICDANIVEYKRESTTLSELHNADIISVEYSNIDEIAEYAKLWIDAGKTLVIAAPQVSAEELSIELDIPNEGPSVYTNELLFAYAIFKVNDLYIYDVHYAIFASDVASGSLDVVTSTNVYESESIGFDSAITMNEIKSSRNLDFNDLINWQSIVSTRQAIEQRQYSTDGAEVQTIDGNTRSTTTGVLKDTQNITLNIYDKNENYCGYARCTSYAHEIGRGYVNNVEGYMYILSYDVKVYPNEKHCVGSYSVTMSCAYEGHTVLRTTTLESNVSTTQSLGFSGALSTSVSTEDIGVGTDRSINYDVSWSHSPESQTFTESSTQPGIITWTAKPAAKVDGKAFGMIPGGEVFVAPGYTGQRSNFFELSVTLKGGLFNWSSRTNSDNFGDFF